MMDYKVIWDGLTKAQQKVLKRLHRREETPQFEFLSTEGMHGNTLISLKRGGFINNTNIPHLTDKGRAVYEASTGQAAPVEAGEVTNEPGDEVCPYCKSPDIRYDGNAVHERLSGNEVIDYRYCMNCDRRFEARETVIIQEIVESTDELADLRAQLEAALEREAKLRDVLISISDYNPAYISAEEILNDIKADARKALKGGDDGR